MPAYNAEKYIGEAIESILCQSLTDFEFLIINDGSTDNTETVIRSYKDYRIRLINQQNKGIAASLNLGLSLARADYIARFDADDIAFPQRLEKQYRMMEKDSDLAVVGTSVNYIEQDGQFVFTWHPPAYSDPLIRKLVKKTCPFIHSSVLYKKSVIVEVGGYNVHAHTFEDHFLWSRIAAQHKMCNLYEPLIQVRLNASSITIDEKWRPREFQEIKKNVLLSGNISPEEGHTLDTIIEKQNKKRIKLGAYYALLGKKYLWNTHDPVKARKNLLKALAFNPLYTTGYGLLAASYLPQEFIASCYKLMKKNSGK